MHGTGVRRVRRADRIRTLPNSTGRTVDCPRISRRPRNPRRKRTPPEGRSALVEKRSSSLRKAGGLGQSVSIGGERSRAPVAPSEKNGSGNPKRPGFAEPRRSARGNEAGGTGFRGRGGIQTGKERKNIVHFFVEFTLFRAVVNKKMESGRSNRRSGRGGTGNRPIIGRSAVGFRFASRFFRARFRGATNRGEPTETRVDDPPVGRFLRKNPSVPAFGDVPAARGAGTDFSPPGRRFERPRRVPAWREAEKGSG